MLRSVKMAGLLLRYGLCLGLVGCIVGIDGDDTIEAGKAASRMNQAIAFRASQCKIEYENALGSSSSSLFMQGPCVGAMDKSRLVRESTVDACVETLTVWPCGEPTSGSSGLFMVTYGMNMYGIKCPARPVPFLFNDVGPPWQGDIIAIGSGSDESPWGIFYFACF